MTEHYVTDQIWFPCDKCGKQITHHSIHTCSPQKHELTDEEIEALAGSIFTEDQTYQYSDVYKFAKALLQKAREK